MNCHLVATLALSLLVGCWNSDTSGSNSTSSNGSAETLNVVCTTNVVKDIVAQVGGARITVTAIMDGPGIDPHVYTPSPRDVNALTAADIVVYSGLHLEGQFDDALEALENRGIPVVCLTEALESEEPTRLLKTEEGSVDPHVWFDPELWASCGEHLAAELGKHDADGSAAYADGAAAFKKQMTETLAVGQENLSGIPDERRVIVTAHDAFAYFARAFNFKVEAVQGISTDSAPGLKRINELIALLIDRRISAVFTEQSVSDKNVSALIERCKDKQHDVSIGGKLFSDTVGADGTPEGTLSGAIRHNIKEIAASLGGETAK